MAAGLDGKFVIALSFTPLATPFVFLLPARWRVSRFIARAPTRYADTRPSLHSKVISCERMAVFTNGFPNIRLASLSHAVVHIIRFGSEKQMPRVATQRRVTAMQNAHTGGDAAAECDPASAMRAQPQATEHESSILHMPNGASLPNPASTVIHDDPILDRVFDGFVSLRAGHIYGF